MWQSVTHFLHAAFGKAVTLEGQRKITVGVLILIMVLAATLIGFIVWADIFYA